MERSERGLDTVQPLYSGNRIRLMMISSVITVKIITNESVSYLTEIGLSMSISLSNIRISS